MIDAELKALRVLALAHFAPLHYVSSEHSHPYLLSSLCQ